MSDARLLEAFEEGLGIPSGAQLGVAVSGGSDSIAMLHLAARLSKAKSLQIFAVTVDHGLRPEAAEEIAAVAAQCENLEIAHRVLQWTRPDQPGNLHNQARRGRYQLIAEWAQENALDAVAIGHTQSDVAETFLMRLSRRAGVDGLSQMPRVWRKLDVEWRRPMLEIGRDQLQEFLVRNGISWCDDPSNEDDKYLRSRTRKLLANLAELDVDAHVLRDVAHQMATARQALEHAAHEAAKLVTHVEGGDVLFDQSKFLALPLETRRRLLQAAIKFVSGAEYSPRESALSEFSRLVCDARQQATLNGCVGRPEGDLFRICREYNAVRQTVTGVSNVWDGRWVLSGPGTESYTVRALGELGLPQCPDWRETGQPRVSLLASPSVWKDDQLIAAPLAGLPNGYRATLTQKRSSLTTFILSH